MSKLTIVPKQPSSAHFQHEKFIRIGTEARFFFSTYKSGIYIYYIIKYMNILLKEIFAGIFVSIAC